MNTENKVQVNWLIGIELKESHFNDIYALGKSKRRPVKFEFVHNLEKKQS